MLLQAEFNQFNGVGTPLIVAKISLRHGADSGGLQILDTLQLGKLAQQDPAMEVTRVDYRLRRRRYGGSTTGRGGLFDHRRFLGLEVQIEHFFRTLFGCWARRRFVDFIRAAAAISHTVADERRDQENRANRQ